MPKRLVVVGGSAAGPKAAAKARRLDEEAEITLIQKDPELSMASCGYPYYVGGVFDERNMLLCTPTGVVRDPKFFFAAKRIAARTQTEVTAIDAAAHRVEIRDLQTGEVEKMEYDRLALCTGSSALMPPLEGRDLEGVTTLKTMQDADYLRRIRDEGVVKRAVIVGGGLIGVETCEALQLAGVEITMVELLPQLLTFLDWEMAKLVENHIRSKGANVITDNGLASFLGEDGKLTGVKLQNGTELSCELAVVAIGVRPNADLAREAGLELGSLGGIAVNEHMQTSDPDIYAAGDCVEIPNLITGKQTYAPLGDLANLEGRVVGENMVEGPRARFTGTIQTGICKVFDYAAGSSGLSEAAARKAGRDDIETVISASPDKPGFMGGKLLVSKMVVNRADGRLLGYQCVGLGDVAREVATAATAIKGGLTIDDLIELDLPYAPPFSLAIDHFIATSHIMQNKLKGRLKGITCREVHERLTQPDLPFLLDTRGPDEFDAMRLGIGETLIPLGALRDRLSELPGDRDREIICYCKISLRGYEAALVLEANGYRNVRVMEGGVMAWPYEREK